MSKYQELRKVDVSKHTEKKGKFTYLSWAWAVDTLLQHDESASWGYGEIKNPNAMHLNTAMQRCLAKAIALHGLGLYIFQGEDLPEGDVLERITNIFNEQGIDEARKYFNTLSGGDRKLCSPFIEKVRESK